MLTLPMFLPLVGPASAATVWVDDTPAGPGDGSQATPFHWGNSADLFDTGMRSFGPGIAIRLVHVPNTRYVFQTRGAYANGQNPKNGFQFKSNQSVIGGQGVVIQLIYVVPNPAPGTGYNIAMGAISPFHKGGVMANQVLLQDLTVDCNGPTLKRQLPYCTLQAIELAGTGNTLRNVTVINAIADRALAVGYDEDFIVSLSTCGANSTGNLIDHCTVQSFYVDKNQSRSTNVTCSAVCLRALATQTNNPFYISGTIQNCIINLNGSRPGKYEDQEYAMNSTFASNLSIVGNVVTGAHRGFSNDTALNQCILLLGNVFNQPPKSWGLMLGSSSDSLARSNRFNLTGPNAIAVGVQGLSKGQQATRWVIRDNRIDSSVAGNHGIYFCLADNSGTEMPRYITVIDNLFTGQRSFIYVPAEAANGCNYLAGNRGTFTYYNSSLKEPFGSPCPYPPICLNY
jgi:hypothetical protein